MTLFEMVDRNAKELIIAQKAVEEAYGQKAFKSLQTVKRNKKTFWAEAVLKDGRTVQFQCRY